MKNRLPILFLCAAAVSGIAPRAQADEHAPSALEQQKANEHFLKGRELFDDAEAKKVPSLYEQAFVEFELAWGVSKADSLLWNLAVSAHMTKRYVKALGWFKEYEGRVHVLADPKHEKYQRLRTLMAEGNAATAHATIEADAGERVFVDEKVAGTAPIGEVIDLAPGRHVFRVGKRIVDAQIAAGTTFVAKLRSEIAAPSVPPGEPPPAKRAVVVAPPPVAPPPDAQRDESFWGVRSYAGLGALGVGVIGIAMGAGFKVDEAHQSNVVSDATTRLTSDPSACAGSGSDLCQQRRDALSARNSDSGNADRAFLVGGVAAVAGAGLLLSAWLVPHTREAKTVGVMPTLGGVVVRGAF